MGGGKMDIIQVDETETISIAEGDLYERKKCGLTLCNIDVHVVFLLSLYSYTKGMRLFSAGISNGTSYRNRYQRAY